MSELYTLILINGNILKKINVNERCNNVFFNLLKYIVKKKEGVRKRNYKVIKLGRDCRRFIFFLFFPLKKKINPFFFPKQKFKEKSVN